MKEIIADDDSSIKAKMKWSNEDFMVRNQTVQAPTIINRNGNVSRRPNHGELPIDMEEPTFLADPNHRKKVLKGLLYKQLKVQMKQRHGLTRVDILRITTNFAYMARSLHLRDEIIEDYGKALLEYHFDNHEYCSDFCKRKTLTEEERKNSAKIYRDKVKDKELYDWLLKTLARFITLSALKEVGHGGDTQVNELLNQTISWLSPKNKTYSGSKSLTNRINIAVGIHLVGMYDYFCDCLEQSLVALSTTISIIIYQPNRKPDQQDWQSLG